MLICLCWDNRRNYLLGCSGLKKRLSSAWKYNLPMLSMPPYHRLNKPFELIRVTVRAMINVYICLWCYFTAQPLTVLSLHLSLFIWPPSQKRKRQEATNQFSGSEHEDKGTHIYYHHHSIDTQFATQSTLSHCMLTGFTSQSYCL